MANLAFSSILHLLLLTYLCVVSVSSTDVEGDQLTQRHMLHSGPSVAQTDCYAQHVDPDDPASLGYYRALADYLDGISAPHPGLGKLEPVPAGFPADATAPINGQDRDVHLLRISALYAFLSTKTNATTGLPYLYNSPGTNRMETAASLLLAAEHFNTGNGAVVREIEGIDQTCSVRLVVDFHDSETNTKTAVDRLAKEILLSDSDSTVVNGGDEDVASTPVAVKTRNPTTVVFGDYRSSITIPLASLNGVYGVPQVCPTCTSTDLDDPNQFPLFGRYVPSDAGTAKAVVSFAAQRNREANGGPEEGGEDLRFIGVLYRNDAFGNAYYLAIKDAFESTEDDEPNDNGVENGDKDQTLDDTFRRTEGVHYDYSSPETDIDRAVAALAKTGYRVFVGVFYSSHYEYVMEAAYRHGIAGPGYVWIMSDGLSTRRVSDISPLPAGSPLAIATEGVGIIKAGSIRGEETEDGTETGFDRMVREWKKQTNDHINYLNCVGHPRTNSEEAQLYNTAPTTFFQESIPPTSGQFLYDSAISFGMAACKLLEEKGGDINPNFDGTELMQQFLSQEFQGASGFVSVDPDTHSRRPESAVFHAWNAQGSHNAEGNETSFEMDVVSYTLPSENPNSTDLKWLDRPGKTFRFSDGSARFPHPLPSIPNFDHNYISPGLRGTFYALAFIIFGMSIFFSCWTFYYRESKVVRAAQPLFLHIICLGTFIMGATIITLGIDDSVATEHGCTIACNLSPWFLSVGFVCAFSSVFAKEWRINKIFHNPSMRRISVSAKDVLIPCIILLGLNVLVLAVWTGLNPLSWDRFFVGTVDKYGRNVESIGICTSDLWAPYVGVILFINMAMVIFANYQAYQARGISVEYSESKHIAVIMVAILQAVAIGLPLVVLVSDDPIAAFVVRAGLIFFICATFLLVLFVPKMMHLRDARVEAEKKAERLAESKARHEEFLKRSKAQESSSSLQTQQTTLSRHSSEASVESTESGIAVLRHPKADKDEVVSLKAKLSEATAREDELRRQITLLKQNQRIDDDGSSRDHPPKTRQSSVTFASDISDDEESPSPKNE